MIGQRQRCELDVRLTGSSGGRTHRIAAACIAVWLAGVISSEPAHAAVEFLNPQPNMLIYRAPFVPRITVPAGVGTLSVDLVSNGVTTSITNAMRLCPAGVPPTSEGGPCDPGEWVALFSDYTQWGLPPDWPILPSLTPGQTTLHATWQSGAVTEEASVAFEAYSRSYDPNATADRQFLDNCEILNDVACLLPFPSSRFTVPDTSPGAPPSAVKVHLPAIPFLPIINPDNEATPLDPTPYNDADGFSPTSQILMHLGVNPQGCPLSPTPFIDLAESGAPVLQPVPDTAPNPPPAAPWENLRSIDATSLSSTSPTLLLEVVEGGQYPYETVPVPHWVELDAHATGDPAHQVLIMRPARALTPGARYIVVVRNLIDSCGNPVLVEPTYDVLRKMPTGPSARTTNIGPLIEKQVHYANEILPWLHFYPHYEPNSPVNLLDTPSIQLSFDFKVRGKWSLWYPGKLLRDAAYAWLDAQLADPNAEPLFEIAQVVNGGTSAETAWTVQGHIRVPIFLWKNPANPEPSNSEVETTVASRLRIDAQGFMVAPGVSARTPFSLDIPRRAVKTSSNPTPVPAYPLVVGHGNFASPFWMASIWQQNLLLSPPAEILDHDYLAGGVAWRGLSDDSAMPFWIRYPGNQATHDPTWLLDHIIALNDQPSGGKKSGLDQFPAWRDRVGQGIANQLVFARMLARGRSVFGKTPCFQQPPTGTDLTTWIDTCKDMDPTATDESSLFPNSPDTDVYYYGVSLGGGMGALLAALSLDITKLVLDVGGTNYSLALQRSTDYAITQTGLPTSVQAALQSILGTNLSGADAGKDKPMNELILIDLLHELWLPVESAGYLDSARCAVHFNDPAYASACSALWPQMSPKQLLLTPAWLDTNVSNQSSELLARSLELKQLDPGTVQKLSVGMPQGTSSPDDSFLVTYSAGWLSAFDLAQDPWLPPLENDTPDLAHQLVPNYSNCVEHGVHLKFNAYRKQFFNFLRPTSTAPGQSNWGRIVNYCDGACDGTHADERPAFGYATCNPPP